MYDEAHGLDKKSLQTQLENYKLIVEVNADWVDKNMLAQEKLAKNLELAQSYLNESCHWEKLGDQPRYDEALCNASMIIMKISAAIRYMLDQDTAP